MSDEPDILLICGDFFGYAFDIQRHLEKRGRRVALFDDRPATDSFTKALIRLVPSFMRAKADKYFDRIIRQARNWPIRDVLVIKAETLSPNAIRRMRNAFPDARFTLYFWDNYRNMPADSPEKASLFDRVFSFDPHDVKKDRRLKYRPLFFSEEFTHLPETERDIDLLFFGSMHDDRFRVLQRIARALPTGLRFVRILYFPAKWLYFAYSFTNLGLLWTNREGIIFKPKSRAEIISLLTRSNTVIDIERPVQYGYTIRTLETLRSGRKLITTNGEVVNADFFNPANIAIISRSAPQFAADFLAKPFEAMPPEIAYRYSLDGWLDEVLPETVLAPTLP